MKNFIAVSICFFFLVSCNPLPEKLQSVISGSKSQRIENATRLAQNKSSEKLHTNKTDGIYLINVDISPGVWQSTGTRANCYWTVSTQCGIILDVYFGNAGNTANIPAVGYQVEFANCGTLEFVSPP